MRVDLVESGFPTQVAGSLEGTGKKKCIYWWLSSVDESEWHTVNGSMNVKHSLWSAWSLFKLSAKELRDTEKWSAFSKRNAVKPC